MFLHRNTYSRNANMTNLVKLYDPVKIVHRAPRQPHTLIGSDRSVRHESLVPDFDLRETAYAYYLDGEFPGIESDNMKVQWLDGRTLRIEGRITKTDVNRV